MPKSSEKKKLLDILVEKAITEVVAYDDDSEEYETAVNNFIMHFMVVSSFRYAKPFHHGSVAKNRAILCKVVPNLDEDRFRELTRINWRTFDLLVEQIRGDDVFNGPNSWKQFPVEIQLLIVLYRLGNYGEGSSVQKTARFFGIGDGGTIMNMTTRVFKAICNLTKKYLYWPDVSERKAIVARTYDEIPYCIGYVDGTEIRIAEKPTVDPESYFSRKHQYSLKVQAVCDDRMIIRHAAIGYPGSLHDSRIFKFCPLYTDPSGFFNGNEYIVGDSAYKLSTTTITPYRTSSTEGKFEERKLFNHNLSQYRVRIENCFGVLKERFPSLKELKIKVGEDKNNKLACQWILTCLVLHNLIRKTGCDEDFDLEDSSTNPDDNEGPDIETSGRDKEAESKRRAILEITKTKNN